MGKKNNVSVLSNAPKKAVKPAFLREYPLSAIETDWIVQGQVNRRFIERKLQDIVGSRNRQDYSKVAQQLDTIIDGFDAALASGETEEELKSLIGSAVIAMSAIAHSAMPDGFTVTVD